MFDDIIEAWIKQQGSEGFLEFTVGRTKIWDSRTNANAYISVKINNILNSQENSQEKSQENSQENSHKGTQTQGSLLESL